MANQFDMNQALQMIKGINFGGKKKQAQQQPQQDGNSILNNKFAMGGLGALAGYMLQPKQKFTTTTRALLDAATLPAMRKAQAARQAQLNAQQGAQGGRGSASSYENVLLRTQNAQAMGQQMALNQVAVNNSQNAAYQNDYMNKMKRMQAALSLGAGGVNAANGMKAVWKDGQLTWVEDKKKGMNQNG